MPVSEQLAQLVVRVNLLVVRLTLLVVVRVPSTVTRVVVSDVRVRVVVHLLVEGILKFDCLLHCSVVSRVLVTVLSCLPIVTIVRLESLLIVLVVTFSDDAGGRRKVSVA